MSQLETSLGRVASRLGPGVDRMAWPGRGARGLPRAAASSRYIVRWGTQVDVPSSNKGRVDLSRRGVAEPVALQHVEHRLALVGRSAPARSRPAQRCGTGDRPLQAAGLTPVPPGTRPACGAPMAAAQAVPARRCARREHGDRPRRSRASTSGSASALSESVPKSACSFACTSTTKRALASSCSSLALLRVAIRRAAGAAPRPRWAPPARRCCAHVAGVQAFPAQYRALAGRAAASYSATTSSLCAVNVRRRAFSAPPGSGRLLPLAGHPSSIAGDQGTGPRARSQSSREQISIPALGESVVTEALTTAWQRLRGLVPGQAHPAIGLVQGGRRGAHRAHPPPRGSSRPPPIGSRPLPPTAPGTWPGRSPTARSWWSVSDPARCRARSRAGLPIGGGRDEPPRGGR